MQNYCQLKPKEIRNELNKHNLLINSYILENKRAGKPRTNSKHVKKNDIFCCIKGYRFDGHDFADEAIAKGANLLICEEKQKYNVNQLVVKNSRKAAALITRLYYKNPSQNFKLIAVTGTNGKTSICHIIATILSRLGEKVGIIGSLGYYIGDEKFSLERTTPDIIQLNKILVRMVKAGVSYVVMEASSHAIELDRIYGLDIDIAVFTNLSQDHLNFHKTMKNYAAAKFKLLKLVDDNQGLCIVNLEDDYGKKFSSKLNNCISVGFDKGDYKISEAVFDFNKSKFILQTLKINYPVTTNLIGNFNILNFAQAIAVLMELSKFEKNEIIKKSQTISSIDGRLESIENEKDLGLYVDYAHTPDALKNVLMTLEQLRKGRLICVFGAGGDRDKAKRPKMLSIALKYADVVFITNDNPRSESPSAIISDIVKDKKVLDKYWIISNRRAAINTAVNFAQKKDIVLIAGKGHEKYQEINNYKIPFDDRAEVKKALRNNLQQNSLTLPIDILQLKHLLGKALDDKTALFRHISTDSRTLQPDSIFFALKGENFDGHDYVEEVIEKEGCWAVVDNQYNKKNAKLIRVDEPLRALGDLAQKYKSLFNIETITITGSVGKTTVKEYVANIFGQNYHILKTNLNENNLIGLPKTIFKLTKDVDFAILEIGSNHFGEIGRLTDICQPDTGIITNIAASHLEFFGDLQGVFKEKTALFDRELKYRLYPGDDEFFAEISGISFGEKQDNLYRIQSIRAENGQVFFKVNEKGYYINTTYKIFAMNALIAIALADLYEISSRVIQRGLAKPLSVDMRMQVENSDKRVLLIDCYNANPTSMLSALNYWKDYKKNQPHIAILGDMLELGDNSVDFHQQIGDRLSQLKSDLLISVGKYSIYYNCDIHFAKVEKLLETKIFNTLPDNAVILLKASHGISLEKTIERF